MRPNINVTPLIDVLLVLLIIFMVITPSKPTAFKAKVPAQPQSEANLPPHPNTLLVSIKSDFSLELNRETNFGTIEDAAALVESLQAEFGKRERDGNFRPGTNEIEKTVFIKAPKNLNYGSVAKVVDAVKLSGANPIGLQIDDLD
jgi:biopolymer transport protein ExbD